jgi:uncharacterized protein (TIGR00106 family)
VRQGDVERWVARVIDEVESGLRVTENAALRPGYRAVMLVAFSITPLGVGEDVGRLVADAIRVVRDSGLPNHTDSMFTTIEGEWDEVMNVVKRAVEAVDAPRVGLTLKADIRPGVTGAITSKVEAVERYLSEG